jgi:ribosome-associated protein
MIKVNSLISLDERELKFSFIKASGPGGQNVNKVATSVQLKFNVYKSENLPDEVKEKIIKNAGKKATTKGIIIIEAKRYRTQEKNKTDAIERLVKLISQSAKVAKKRKKTKPTKAADEKRIEVKKKKSTQKTLRKKVSKNNEY